jgi:hypothetical protein
MPSKRHLSGGELHMQCVNSLSTVFDCPFDFESLEDFPICNVGCRRHICVEFLSCSDFQVLKYYLQLRGSWVAPYSNLQFNTLRNALLLHDIRGRILPHSLMIDHGLSCPSNDICMDCESGASRWRPRLWKLARICSGSLVSPPKSWSRSRVY